MKVVGFILLGLASFLATLAGALAFTGNLSKGGFQKLFGTAPVSAPKLAEERPDELSEFARALKARGQELDTRQTTVEQEQKRLEDTRTELQTLRDTLRELITQMTATADTHDANEAQRLQEVAKSLEGMKPAQAAKAVEEWPPEDGAKLLQLIEERARGKILDAMNPDRVTAFLRAMRQQTPAS